MIMDLLKKFWPTAFSVKKGDVVSLVIQLLVFIVVCGVIGILIGVFAKIWLIGVIFKILGTLLEAYGIVGIVLSVLRFFDVV